MSSPFNPDRFVHGASCLPCCAPTGNNVPTPFICNCELPFYRWGMISENLFPNLEEAMQFTANQTANALVVGLIDATQQNLTTLEATYDPLDVSPNLSLRGTFPLANIGGGDSAFMDLWASISIAPNASLEIAFDVALVGLAAGTSGARVQVYTCNKELLETQENFTGGISLSGNFLFGGPDIVGGEYHVHFIGYGDNDENNVSGSLSCDWRVTSNNNFAVGQPVAQIDPEANIVLDEFRTRPGYDRLFSNTEQMDFYIENMQAGCFFGLDGSSVFGVNVLSVDASFLANVIDFEMVYDEAFASMPVVVSLSLNAGAMLTINVLNIPTEAIVTASLLNRKHNAVLAQNNAGTVPPFTIELTAPNTGEYILQLFPDPSGSIRNVTSQNYSISCNQALQVNDIVPKISLGSLRCPLTLACEIVP